LSPNDNTPPPSPENWTEADSQLYRQLAPVAVPARVEQIACLLTLLPFKQDETFRAVELGCGEGLLSLAVLDCFRQAELIALDGSAEMRRQASKRLETFGNRATVTLFDLASLDWLAFAQDADCVLSSLCIHHLKGPEKQALFAALYERLSSRGVLLIADLIQPQRPEARDFFAATYDRIATAQSLAETGSTELFDLFVETEWNYYSFEDPADTPSPLIDQLVWLKEVGFAVADCFWLQAGHAIYGGYKNDLDSGGGISYKKALDTARVALQTITKKEHG
jgi:tRNA (cmo5U34)-methyltransferase